MRGGCTRHSRQSTLLPLDRWAQDVPRDPRPGAHNPRVSLNCLAPRAPLALALNDQDLALPADPVEGDVIPLRVKPPPQHLRALNRDSNYKSQGEGIGWRGRLRRTQGPRIPPQPLASRVGSGPLSSCSARPLRFICACSRGMPSGCAGGHSAPRPLPRPPATPRPVDSSGA